MKSYRKWMALLCVSAAALCGTLGARAEGPSRAPAVKPAVANVTAGISRVDWILREPSGAVLTVSAPDGTVERQEFKSGAPILFSAFAGDGSSRPDGVYTWELSVVRAPNEGALRSLANGEESVDGRRFEAQAAAGVAREVDSGTFWIQNGTVVAGGLPEPLPARRQTAPKSQAGKEVNSAGGGSMVPLDQVIADDLIVQGSACIGLDCVNNESFGFDTIRMKENNTRIKFEDTSSSAGFATHDWQLTANDSASGGAEKFSIEDITAATVPFTVRGSAPNNSLYVDSTGRVGLHTSTPVLDIHAATGNTPALRLEQNNAGGFTAQTWDIAGNEANFFVRDVTGGSRLPLRIRPGAPTSSIDISASGNVGIGTASPTAGNRLEVQGGAIVGALGVFVTTGRTAGVDSNGSDGLTFRTNTTNDRMNILSNGNVGIGMVAPTNPLQMGSGAICTAGGIWQNASSREYKQDIEELSTEAAAAALLQLNPVTYSYKAAPAEHHVGFIAEDVPDLVASTDRKSLSPMDLVAVLTKVIQEQEKRLSAQSLAIGELKSRLEEVEKQR